MPDTAPSKRTLWNIADDFTEFESLIESIDDDISEEDAAKLADFYDNLETERDKKLDNCGRFIRNLETDGKACLEEAARLEALGKSRIKKADGIKDRVKAVFKFKGWDKPISTTFFTFKRAMVGGVLPLILDEKYEKDPALLPEQFQKKVPEFDKSIFQNLLESEDPSVKALVSVIVKTGALKLTPKPDNDSIRKGLEDPEVKKTLEGIAKFGERGDKLNIK